MSDALYRVQGRTGETKHNKDVKKPALRSCHIDMVKLDILAQKRADWRCGVRGEEPLRLVAA